MVDLQYETVRRGISVSRELLFDAREAIVPYTLPSLPRLTCISLFSLLSLSPRCRFEMLCQPFLAR